MTIDKKMLLIRNYNLFAQFTESEYNELNIVHRFIEAPKGEYIYFEAKHHSRLYFIKDGYVKIGYINDSGKEVVKEIIQKGEIFGQFTLERNNMNGEFAQAYKSDVSLCAFTVEDFEKLLQKKPELSLKYSKQVGQKLRMLENRLLNLLHKDVRTRLIHFYGMLAINHLGHSDSITIENFLTHEDIANLIGSSRQTVTTTINDLESEGLLGVSRNEIVIPSVKKIQKAMDVV